MSDCPFVFLPVCLPNVSGIVTCCGLDGSGLEQLVGWDGYWPNLREVHCPMMTAVVHLPGLDFHAVGVICPVWCCAPLVEHFRCEFGTVGVNGFHAVGMFSARFSCRG